MLCYVCMYVMYVCMYVCMYVTSFVGIHSLKKKKKDHIEKGTHKQREDASVSVSVSVLCMYVCFVLWAFILLRFFVFADLRLYYYCRQIFFQVTPLPLSLSLHEFCFPFPAFSQSLQYGFVYGALCLSGCFLCVCDLLRINAKELDRRPFFCQLFWVC